MMIDGDFLDRARRVSDTPADELVDAIFHKGIVKDFYKYLKLEDQQVAHDDSSPEIKNFLLTKRKNPEWFSSERIAKGQLFFQKYALDIMTLLGALSLPYCYAATPGNKALYLTEKMRKSPGMRLLDTAHFIIEVLKSGALEDGATGFIQINKTRLIHALVRYHLKAGNMWNEKWGVPVNQEDMAGTNLAFSYIIVLGLRKAKFILTDEEQEDFLFVWRYIGYQLHIMEELLPENYEAAAELEKMIRLRHFKKSEEGENLTKDLIKHYKENFPVVASYFVDGQIRYFLGSEVAAILGMQPQPFKDKLVKMINRLKERLNQKYVDPRSYQKMLQNHEILKKKYF